MNHQEEVAPSRSSRPRTWRDLLLPLTSAAAIVVGLFTLAGFAARYHWRCEQLCHFRVQYFWLLACGAAVLMLGRKRGRASLFGLLALVNLVTIVPIYMPAAWVEQAALTETGRAAVPLKLVTFNVRASNQKYEQVVDYLRSQRPDVAVILEVSPEWSSALQRLRDEYPHQHHVPRDDNFGISLVSRIPWRSVETAEFEDHGVPSVVARFERTGTAWMVVGTHPVPPGSAWTSQSRNRQLSALARLCRQENGAVILAGDLNATGWSPYFADLLRDGNLRDSRQGRGVHFSWVSRIPLTNLPIDHILISPGIIVRDRRVGPHLGSDHCPVVADLLLPGQ